MNNTPHSGGWNAIQATPEDEHILQELLLNSHEKHQHLDWFRSQELLGRPPFLFAYFDDQPQGGLACPPEPQDTAWLRLFFSIRGASPQNVWESLWPDARLSAIEQGATKFAALIFDPWFRKILIDSDFSETNTQL